MCRREPGSLRDCLRANNAAPAGFFVSRAPAISDSALGSAVGLRHIAAIPPAPVAVMAAAVCQTVSHETVLEQPGCGGMDVVSKAEDTRVTRSVAPKVLPPRSPEIPKPESDSSKRRVRLPSDSMRALHDIDEIEGGGGWSPF